ncbi:hypothetical protein KR044_010990 [Drosophila immigrans]|nr:hypothetical protein KR044_010990 [Drosophila immigrans]
MLIMSVLDYPTYEAYLDHFITINDVRYLRNLSVSRLFIRNACAKSCMGRLLSRSEFTEQRTKLKNLLHPRFVSESTLFGEGYDGSDHVLEQFAKREYSLLNKQLAASIWISIEFLIHPRPLQTIIFLVMRSKRGLEVSGFIDLEQSFRESRFKSSQHYVNWSAIFEGKAKLMPESHHLSYFDWNKNKILINDSDNFQVFSQGAHSLLMMHRGDRKIVCVNAYCHCHHKRNVTHSTYTSSIYGQCIFFDHIVRRFN